jgi:hypothetical protein
MLTITYIAIAVSFVMFALAAYFRSSILMLITGLALLIPTSIYIFIFGLGTLSNFATQMFGAVTFGLGCYVSVRASIELLY